MAKEAERLHQQLEQLQAAHTAAQEHAGKLESSLSDSAAQLSEVLRQKADLQSEVDSLKQQVQHVQEELSAMHQAVGQLQELQEQQAAAELQLQELQKEEQVANAALNLAKKQLQECESVCRSAQDAASVAQEQAQAACRDLQRMQVQRQACVHIAAAQLPHSTSAQVASDADACAAQQKLQDLQAEHAALEQQKLQLASETEALQAQMALLLQDCETATQQKQDVEAQVSALQQRLVELQQEEASAAVDISHLQQKAARAEQLQQEVATLRLELSELEQLQQQHLDTAAAAGFTTSISLDPNTPARSREHLKWELSSLGDELKAAEQRRKAAEQQLTYKDRQLEDLHQQVAELQQQMQELSKREAPAASYAAVLKAEHSAASENLFEADMQKHQEQVAVLQAQVQADAAEIQRLSGLLNASSQQEAESATHLKLDTALQSAAQLQQQVQKLTAEYEALKQAAEKQRKAAEASVQGLQQEVEELTLECQAAKQAAQEGCSAADTSKAESIGLQAALAKAQQEMQQLQEALAAEREKVSSTIRRLCLRCGTTARCPARTTSCPVHQCIRCVSYLSVLDFAFCVAGIQSCGCCQRARSQQPAHETAGGCLARGRGTASAVAFPVSRCGAVTAEAS